MSWASTRCSGLWPLAQDRFAGEQEAAAETCGSIPTETATADGVDGSKRTVGVRLCLRRLRKRPADQMPDRGSIRSGRMIEVLSRLISEHGAPQSLRSDNGPKFVSKALLKWESRESTGSGGVSLTSHDKWFGRGFNDNFRNECLPMK